MARICKLSLLVILLFVEGVTARKILKSKIRARGSTYSIAKDSDLHMCKAVVWEMHGEIHKHQLTDDGEEKIYDTSEMAVCLGVVQNYTFTKTAGKSGGTIWKMMKKDKKEDEDEDAEWEAVAQDPSLLDGMMLTKQACFDFCEEVQMEISEEMYARTNKESAQQIADSFCPVLLKNKKNEDKGRNKKPYEPVKESAWDDPSSDPTAKMQQFLKERDRGGAINELLELEAFTPEKMLDEELQVEVHRGERDLKCAVCEVAVKVAANRAEKLRQTPQYKDKWQRESLVTDIIVRVCHGDDYERLQQGFYPEVPGNPPKWADNWEIEKGPQGKWSMKRAKKKSKPARPEGEEEMEEEEPQEVAEGEPDAHQMKIMRNAMISLACKAAVDNRLSEDDGDLAELLVDHGDRKTGKELAKEFCRPMCDTGKQEL